MSEQAFILDIVWEVPDMPRLVGPFPTRAEAEEFARVNVPNGAVSVRELHYPYMRKSVR